MQVTDEMVEVACAHHWPGPWPGDRSEPILAMRRDDMRAALTAALADKQAVEVKALEWSRVNADGTIHIASALPGEYWAWELAGYGYWSWGSLTGREVPGGLDAAKAAAQHDYATRIRSALVDVPAVEPVAWRTRGMNARGDWVPWVMVDEQKALRWKNDPSYKNGRRQVEPLYTSPPLSREGEDSAEVDRLTRPIVGIEHRTTQEVFDIMAERFRLAATRSDSATIHSGGGE